VIVARGVEQSGVTRLAERIRRAVEGLLVTWEQQMLRVTVSLGVASLQECGDVGTSESLLLLSDERLYEAKNSGRNKVVSG
jgi:diguanylate cyclase (GGDEF)-like protein